jgi:glycoside/pentoside/hexuronide:cation symporter, GPH family
MHRMSATDSPTRPIGWRQCLSYGLMGLPLAFVALPLYVILPNHYAREFGVPLGALGGVLLATRLLDAFIDPLLGRLSDRLYRRSLDAVLWSGAVACVVMALGLALLLYPPTREPLGLLMITALLLMLTYAAFSFVTIAHQSWGALLGSDAVQQSRLVALREGLGLLGVLLASSVPALYGLSIMVLLFWLALTVAWLAWLRAPHPAHRGHMAGPLAAAALWLPLRRAAFRRLMAVFVINGIASAVPATLVLFFVQDRLQATQAMEPFFLGTYFLCTALSMPLWLKVVRRFGLARSWLLGMLLSVGAFTGTSLLGSGDAMRFMVICALSGLALGADLALPGAMLAGVMARAGDLGRVQGGYFGWWNFATKLNLALAAGVTLPLLGLFGYVPGARDPQALQALVVAYGVLPCVLKLLAASLLYFLIIRRPRSDTSLQPLPAKVYP